LSVSVSSELAVLHAWSYISRTGRSTEKIRIKSEKNKVKKRLGVWGGYRILEKGVQDTDHLRRTPVGGSGDILPWKIVQFVVLGNGISSMLRPSQRVMPPFFLTEGVPPKTPNLPSPIVFPHYIVVTVRFQFMLL